MTRPSDPVKLVYRISRNPPDKGTSCVVVHNVRKFHYFWRDLPFWLWNFDQYGKENVWNSVITTRRNLIYSNLGINKDILCRCALCTILGIFTFKLWLRHKLSAQLVLKHWIVLWTIVVDKDIMCRHGHLKEILFPIFSWNFRILANTEHLLRYIVSATIAERN